MNDSIRHRQEHQPWTQPYSAAVEYARANYVPHLLATHCALHAAKSVGKLAAVFEAMDHPVPGAFGYRPGPVRPTDEQLETIKSMAADLFTAALRFANLYDFDLADVHQERVIEKNYPGGSLADLVEGRSL